MWGTLRSALTNPLIAGPLAGLLVAFLAYLDAKLRDVKREKDTYWKLGIVSALIMATVVYLVGEEFTKTDEFLNQTYETELRGSMMPRRHGGFETSEPFQPNLRGPAENLQEMMSSLEPSATMAGAPEMPAPSLFTEPPQVSMSVSRVSSARHSGKGRKSSHRSSRHSGKKYRSSRHSRRH